MYTENVYLNNVSADYFAYTPQYQPKQNTEQANTFNDVINETIATAQSQYQTKTATDTEKTNQTGNSNISGYCPMTSVPPEIKPSEKAEASYIDKYYTIAEADVIQGLRDLRRIVNNADLSEKTNVEKYDWLENLFSDKFGKDFLMARNLSMPSSMFYMIGVEFSDTLNRLFDDPAQVNRERLFGDKSTEEIQNSIRERFSEPLTNRDLFLMVNEMRNSGVLDSNALRSIGADGTCSVFDTLDLLRSYAKLSTQNSNDEIGKLSLEERDRRWSSMLNMPINLNSLKRLYNAWSQDGRFSMGTDIGSFIQSFLGGVKNSNGLFVIPAHSNGQHDANGNGGVTNIHFVDNAVNSGTFGDSQKTINVSTNVADASNSSKGNSNNDIEEKDWDQMLRMMLSGLDEYDDLIRSRMQMIDAEDYPVLDEISDAENPGVDEVPGVEDSYGAEENLESDEAEDAAAEEESSENSENAA